MTRPIAQPRGTRGVTLGRVTLLVHRRTVIVCVGMLLVGTALTLVALLTGTYPVSRGQMGAILTGHGQQPGSFLVLDQRLPRALAALLCGMVLGGSGAVFQATSRNPLASPDIIGFSTGAATGGLVTIVLAAHPTSGLVTLGTLIGGAGTALVVAILSAGPRRGVDRMILTGICVAAMLSSVNEYLLTRSDLDTAEAAVAWRHGSLNAITWTSVIPLAVGTGLLAVPFISQTRSLRLLELGDDCAAGLGVDVPRTRAIAMALGVGGAALAVSAAGPVGFVALGAPQVARRLCGSAHVPCIISTLTGAVLLAGADVLAQRMLSPTQIPVGYVTAAIGGVYLLHLLLRHPG